MIDVTLLAFAMVAFIGIATPGPTVLLALANGSKFGVRRAVIGMAVAWFIGIRQEQRHVHDYDYA